MSRAYRRTLAKQKAEALLREHGIDTLPVDPFAIAARYGIVIQAKPDAAPGVSGMLFRHGDNFGILYPTHIPSEGFQRFSMAHELGHYFLDGHVDHVIANDGIHASHAGFVSADPYERDADQFAACLLLPAAPFRRELGKHEPGLATVLYMADICVTSLTATGIRYAELTDDAVAVILSTDRSIDFCRLSETMKSLKELTWFKRGLPVPKGTATAELNADPGRIKRAEWREREIDIMDWLGGVRSVPAIEEVIGLGDYGKTLTILTCPVADESYDDDDGDDQDDLMERWTPRFRR